MSLSIKYLILSALLFIFSFASMFALAAENNQSGEQGVKIKSPATDLWRAVRQREFQGSTDFTAKTQVKTLNAGRLINAEGNEWRKLRREKVIPYSAYFILGVIALLALITILVRPVKIPNGRSGENIPRMSVMHRIVHWFMALLVIAMGLTGMVILFGRVALIPFTGSETFSLIASPSLEIHNFLGLGVVFSFVIFLVSFIRYNLPALCDFKWLITLGGLLTKKHLENGFFNAGEKILFWLTILFGFTLSATGLLLFFPEYQTLVKLNSQWLIVIHSIVALFMIALILGHIWMVRTVKGTLEAITKGTVDANWAKSHHSIWYKKVIEKSALMDKSKQ